MLTVYFDTNVYDQIDKGSVALAELEALRMALAGGRIVGFLGIPVIEELSIWAMGNRPSVSGSKTDFGAGSHWIRQDPETGKYANLAGRKSGFRGIGLCPDIRSRTGSRSATAGRGSACPSFLSSIVCNEKGSDCRARQTENSDIMRRR